MPIINKATKEVTFKIVYQGIMLGGKTTNMVRIHEHTQASRKGKLVSLASSSDRTLFFDFVPVESLVEGWRTTLQLYTVPGQVHHSVTRQIALRGVDGVIFVADSQY